MQSTNLSSQQFHLKRNTTNTPHNEHPTPHRWYRSLCRRLYVSSPGGVFWCTLWHLKGTTRWRWFAVLWGRLSVLEAFNVAGPQDDAFFYIISNFTLRWGDFFLRWSLNVFRVQGGLPHLFAQLLSCWAHCVTTHWWVFSKRFCEDVECSPAWTQRPHGVFSTLKWRQIIQ